MTPAISWSLKFFLSLTSLATDYCKPEAVDWMSFLSSDVAEGDLVSFRDMDLASTSNVWRMVSILGREEVGKHWRKGRKLRLCNDGYLRCREIHLWNLSYPRQVGLGDPGMLAERTMAVRI